MSRSDDDKPSNEQPINGHPRPGMSRRQVLYGTAAAGAVTLLPLQPARAAAAGTKSAGKKTVVVLGGGMSGLAAAHELIERGFNVTVFERKALGGKARSIPVPGTGKQGRRDLQGEHGFRFFPGFYRNVPDTMRRIPVPGNANGVHDNMIDLTSTRISRNAGRSDIIVPELTRPGGTGLDLDVLKETLTGLTEQVAAIPASELSLFVNRFIVYLTSSDERRLGQWERLPWWDYVKAEGKSKDYRAIVARFLTRGLVAVKEEVASTRTVGAMGQAFLLSGLGLGADGGLARMLNAPTNEAWIDPWVTYLRSRGVRFEVGQTVEALDVASGRIRSAHLIDAQGKRRTAEADWFVCAMPVERARALLSPAILALDPSLAGMNDLHTEWMNGLQFFLRKSPHGIDQEVNFMDSPWQLTAVLQSRLWNRDFPRDYGDGQVTDCLSLDISDWDTPGIVTGRPAKECSPAEVAKECWAQMKDHLEDTGRSVLPDGLLHSWFLDPAIAWNAATRRNTNDEPLMVNTVGSWAKRPRSRTRIPNLFMAGDYVQTNMDLATMEGANESGRAAANALLDAADSPAKPADLWKLYQPPELDGLKKLDAQRFRTGLPNLFDT
ncbi:FAD-dependent oxidoreductase [Actinomadura barringtoniae]|uniref:FAD-dependent oxidoreductase n=1 Tax=Actinomadura barringtoniae TaxID=1427535 RepID=A0A939PD91_9ACTN|nr:FAD-dependent oxidoreductase [Actinomadura barringtoniae]MBO2446356.1 FAD-dependent oxidoreductase [Actinomadura barringtoniae]